MSDGRLGAATIRNTARSVAGFFFGCSKSMQKCGHARAETNESSAAAGWFGSQVLVGQAGVDGHKKMVMSDWTE